MLFFPMNDPSNKIIVSYKHFYTQRNHAVVKFYGSDIHQDCCNE